MSNRKRRYFAYLRISKDPDGTSTAPERQLKDIHMFARLRGFEIVEVYKDTDLSAYKKGVTRPGYEEMLVAMEEGACDGVIVWKLDRLIRRITEFSRFWKIAQDADVDLVSVNDPIDTREPVGVAFVYLLVGLAEQEARNMGLRLRAKERENAAAGKRKRGGKRSYGMERDGTIVEHEAEIIREMAERLVAGENPGNIARDLNQREVPTSRGARWSRKTIENLMQQGRLFGWREHLGELVAQGDWEPILDEATGRHLREILVKKTVPGRGDYKTARSTLLTGLLRCTVCGRGLKAGKRPGPNPRLLYRCPPPSDGGCSRTSILRPETDQAVTEMVLYRLESPELLNVLRARRNSRQSSSDASLLAELAGYGEKADELADAFADGDLDRVAYARAVRKLDERVTDINRRLAEATQAEPLAELLEAKGGLRRAWEQLSTERQRAIMEVVLEKVIVHPQNSEYALKGMAETFRIEAEEFEAAGDKVKARRRRAQAENPQPGGPHYRPERLEPIWRV